MNNPANGMAIYAQLVQVGFPIVGSIVLAWIAYKVALINKTATATHLLVNSAQGVADDLLVTTLEELLTVKAGDQSVTTRLGAARKARDQHRISQAVVDDRNR